MTGRTMTREQWKKEHRMSRRLTRYLNTFLRLPPKTVRVELKPR